MGLFAEPASGLVSIETVHVGYAGNPSDALTGYGSVGYEYWMGKYEVTLNQYATFLNAVAPTDTYSLYNPSMASDAKVAGIVRSGDPGSYTYSVVGNGARPVTYVSWFDAARFVNWVNNGQPVGAQTAATTEDGAYSLFGAMSGVTIARNPDVAYYIPTENEWYKAAYYHPNAQGGPTNHYWLYPTRSNTQPNSRNGSPTDPNSANYYYNDGINNGFNGGYAVNDSTVMPAGNVLTEVGAFEQAFSFFGTFDQAGNVWEWNEAVLGSNRGIRGGSWALQASQLRSTWREGMGPGAEIGSLGFRVVMIPEPNIFGLTAVGFALLAWSRKRNR
jgi:formylglycine-generating enzyme